MQLGVHLVKLCDEDGLGSWEPVMIAAVVPPDHDTQPDVIVSAFPRVHGARPALRVWAPTVADAVRWAGGLMCDKALDGWHVVVEVRDPSDPQALHILGAGVEFSGSGDADLFGHSGTSGSGVAPAQSSRAQVQHVVSLAARAFRARALEVAGIQATVGAVETFRSVGNTGACGCS